MPRKSPRRKSRKKSPKRKSPKIKSRRKSPKRKSPKRKSTKRKSPKIKSRRKSPRKLSKMTGDLTHDFQDYFDDSPIIITEKNLEPYLTKTEDGWEFEVLPQGMKLYRTQPVLCGELKGIYDKKTDKTGSYFSNGIYIPLGMILEYDKERATPRAHKDMYLCQYEVIKPIVCGMSNRSPGSHIERGLWPIYPQLFGNNVSIEREIWETTREAEVFITEDQLGMIQQIPGVAKLYNVKEASDIVASKLDELKKDKSVMEKAEQNYYETLKMSAAEDY